MSPFVLVTGGAGYIGSHTSKALFRAGYSPVAYDNMTTGNSWAVKWGPLELGDILDEDRLDEVFVEYRPKAVIHLAALASVPQSVRSPNLYYQNNVKGTINVIDACRRHGVDKIIFSSTCAVYGVPDVLPVTEDTPTAPISPYGASKLMVERVLKDYSLAFGIRYAVLRYFNAAGADPEGELGESRPVETHLIPSALEAALGHRPPLVVAGEDFPTSDGTAVRDYVHVSDVSEVHVRALDYLEQEGSVDANLSTGHGHSVRQVIGCIEGITGLQVPYSIGPRRPGDPPTLIGISRRDALLGQEFGARSSLEIIIATAWQWHRQRRSRADTDRRLSTNQARVSQLSP